MNLPQSVQIRILKRLLADKQVMDILNTYVEAKEIPYYVPAITVGIVETNEKGEPLEKPSETKPDVESKDKINNDGVPNEDTI